MTHGVVLEKPQKPSQDAPQRGGKRGEYFFQTPLGRSLILLEKAYKDLQFAAQLGCEFDQKGLVDIIKTVRDGNKDYIVPGKESNRKNFLHQHPSLRQYYVEELFLPIMEDKRVHHEVRREAALLAFSSGLSPVPLRVSERVALRMEDPTESVMARVSFLTLNHSVSPRKIEVMRQLLEENHPDLPLAIASEHRAFIFLLKTFDCYEDKALAVLKSALFAEDQKIYFALHMLCSAFSNRKQLIQHNIYEGEHKRAIARGMCKLLPEVEERDPFYIDRLGIGAVSYAELLVQFAPEHARRMLDANKDRPGIVRTCARAGMLSSADVLTLIEEHTPLLNPREECSWILSITEGFNQKKRSKLLLRGCKRLCAEPEALLLLWGYWGCAKGMRNRSQHLRALRTIPYCCQEWKDVIDIILEGKYPPSHQRVARCFPSGMPLQKKDSLLAQIRKKRLPARVCIGIALSSAFQEHNLAELLLYVQNVYGTKTISRIRNLAKKDPGKHKLLLYLLGEPLEDAGRAGTLDGSDMNLYRAGLSPTKQSVGDAIPTFRRMWSDDESESNRTSTVGIRKDACLLFHSPKKLLKLAKIFSELSMDGQPELREYADLLRRCVHNGIYRPFRLKKAQLHTVLDNLESGVISEDEKIFLFVGSRADHNGVIGREIFHLFELIREEGYKILYFEFGSRKDVVDLRQRFLKISGGKKASIMFVDAHANERVIQAGDYTVPITQRYIYRSSANGLSALLSCVEDGHDAVFTGCLLNKEITTRKGSTTYLARLREIAARMGDITVHGNHEGTTSITLQWAGRGDYRRLGRVIYNGNHAGE